MRPEKNECKDCPFCGHQPEIHKHTRFDMWTLFHRCRLVGTITMTQDWWDHRQEPIDLWNTRLEPIHEADR